MGRSIWKDNFSELNLYLLKKKKYSGEYYKITDRNSFILRKHINIFFKIYNGIKFVFLFVTENHVNHKFGEFSITCKMGSKIHDSKKNRLKRLKKR
jgi:ribosomal protein S19